MRLKVKTKIDYSFKLFEPLPQVQVYVKFFFLFFLRVFKVMKLAHMYVKCEHMSRQIQRIVLKGQDGEKCASHLQLLATDAFFLFCFLEANKKSPDEMSCRCAVKRNIPVGKLMLFIIIILSTYFFKVIFFWYTLFMSPFST